MADVIIHGSPNSTFVRTARLACEEKGITHELRAIGQNTRPDLKTPEYKKLHPFGKIPTMQHGDFTLYESTAIARYIDETFNGPALRPSDLKERALMEQWISSIQDNYVPVLLWGFVAEHIFGSGPDGKPDQKKIESAKPQIRERLEILDNYLTGRTFIAGDSLSIADMLFVPIGHYVGNLPGGLPLFDGLENLGRWWDAVSTRPSFKTTHPPMLQKEAA